MSGRKSTQPKLTESSQLDLLASVQSAKAQFEAERRSSKSKAFNRIDKQALAKSKTTWHRSNRGVLARAQKDAALRLSADEFQASKLALEKKAKRYERMRKFGEDMTLEGEAADNLMVDFDRKWAEADSDEEFVESDHGLGPEDQDGSDPFVEIVDDFGRTRQVRQSQAPVVFRAEAVAPRNIIYGPNYMPTFNPDEEKAAEILHQSEVVEQHYDATSEIRQRGTAYMNLGTGEERIRNLDELGEARIQTQTAREGESASEKRKRVLAERNEMIREKRRLKEGEAFLDSLS